MPANRKISQLAQITTIADADNAFALIVDELGENKKISLSDLLSSGGIALATADTAGIVKIGDGLSITADGTLSALGGGGGGGGGVTSLGQLDDVNVQDRPDQSLLQYVASAAQWQDTKTIDAGQI